MSKDSGGTRDRPASLELRIVSESDGRERAIRSIRLPRATRAALAAGAIACLAGLLAAAAVAPSVWAAVRARREYDLLLARRAQLGERLHALVAQFVALERQGDALDRRIARVATAYGLPAAAEPRPQTGASRARASASIYASAIARGQRLAAALSWKLGTADLRLAQIETWERAHPEEAELAPVRWPLGEALAVPTSGFGLRRAPAGGVGGAPGALEFHAGLDLAATEGAPIFAPAPGVVVWAGEAPGDAGPAWWRLGRLVAVRHGDRFLSIFGHCGAISVPRGRRVAAGDELARVGTSGWTAVPQLHYELRRREGTGWRAVDPRELLLERELSGPPAPRPSAGPPAPPPLPRAFAPAGAG